MTAVAVITMAMVLVLGSSADAVGPVQVDVRYSRVRTDPSRCAFSLTLTNGEPSTGYTFDVGDEGMNAHWSTLLTKKNGSLTLKGQLAQEIADDSWVVEQGGVDQQAVVTVVADRCH